MKSFSSAAGDDDSAALSLNFPNEPWFGDFLFKQIGESFLPALGFINRTAIRQYVGTVAHLTRFRNMYLNQLEFGTNFEYVTDLNDRLESRANDIYVRRGLAHRRRDHVSNSSIPTKTCRCCFSCRTTFRSLPAPMSGTISTRACAPSTDGCSAGRRGHLLQLLQRQLVQDARAARSGRARSSSSSRPMRARSSTCRRARSTSISRPSIRCQFPARHAARASGAIRQYQREFRLLGALSLGISRPATSSSSRIGQSAHDLQPGLRRSTTQGTIRLGQTFRF